MKFFLKSLLHVLIRAIPALLLIVPAFAALGAGAFSLPCALFPNTLGENTFLLVGVGSGVGILLGLKYWWEDFVL